MIRILLLPRIVKKTDCDFLKLALSERDSVYMYQKNIETNNFKNLVEFVKNSSDFDYLMLPHDYFHIYKNKKYIKQINDIVSRYQKKVIVFAYGNKTSKIDIDNSIVLRTSQYKSLKKDHEIIVPPFVEDLGLKFGFNNKELDLSQKPIIGFLGSTSCSSLSHWIRYVLGTLTQFVLIKIKKLHSDAIYHGLHFRRKIISLLRSSSSVVVSLFVKNKYITDKKNLKEDYVSVIKDSNLILAVRGVGNYSSKFFEILSLGKIPLFVDTDICLPLENEIDYDDFILKIDYKELDKLPEIVEKFWRTSTKESLLEMQTKARQAFKYRLSTHAFYKYLFSNFDEIIKNNKN